MKQSAIIFRLDDISWDMNGDNFLRIRELFIRYGIKPLIGVIPCNKDEKLVKQARGKGMSQEAFWKEIKTLQDEYGWSIALHGFNHVYKTQNGGLFRINNRSEFAGVPYDEQFRMIKEGKRKLNEYGLETNVFMAPAHSLDWNTVAALRENGIAVVTDGIAAYPYRKRGIWFIPQVANWPQKRARGVESVCFHINDWKEEKFLELEKFIQNNVDLCDDFQNVIDYAVNGEYVKHSLFNFFSGIYMKIYVIGRGIKYRISIIKNK